MGRRCNLTLPMNFQKKALPLIFRHKANFNMAYPQKQPSLFIEFFALDSDPWCHYLHITCFQIPLSSTTVFKYHFNLETLPTLARIPNPEFPWPLHSLEHRILSPRSSCKAWKALGQNHIGHELHCGKSFHFSVTHIENAQALLPLL